MAELNFIITADNSGMMQALQETQAAMRRTAQSVEQIGELLNLEEFKEASASVTDFATKLNEATQESINSLSNMSQQFSTQADTIRAELESMLGSGATDGMSEKLEDYKQAVMDAAASAETAYNLQGVAVAALAEELDTLKQAQEAAFTAGDSGTATAMQADIDALSATLEQANARLGELGQQADAANTSLNGLDAAMQQFGGGAQTLGQLWGDVGAKMKEATQSMADWATGNGKFQQSLQGMKSALGEMGGMFAPAIAGAKKLLVAMRAMIATPLGAVLAAVVLALKAMHSWFTKSADGQRTFAKLSAYIGSILNSIIDVVIDVGKYLFKAFSDPTKPLGAFARSVGSTFVNAIKSAYHVVKGFATAIGALVDVFKGAANFDGDAILKAWDKFKDAGSILVQGFSEAGQAFKSGLESSVNLVKSVASVATDMVSNFSFDKLEKGFSTMIQKAQESSELKGREVDMQLALNDARGKQAEYEQKIGEQYEKMYKLKGKERLDAIQELKQLQKAKYEDLIGVQTQLYEITKKNNSLHASTLEDLTKEKELRVQMLQTQAQQASATRMLARLEASTQNKLDASAQKAAKASAKATASTKKIDPKAIAAAQSQADEIDRKTANEKARAQVKFEEALADAQVAAMKDGAEKVRAEREAQNRRELEALAEQADAAKEAEYQRQKSVFEAQQKLLAAQGHATEEWSEAMLDKDAIQAIADQYDQLAELIKQKQKNIEEQEEQSAMRAYLQNYGTYQERRLAIAEEYADKIAKAMTDGDRLALEKQKEAALSQLDKEFGLKAQEMADLFGDASEKSIKSIDAIIKKYEALVDFMSGINGGGKGTTREDLLAVGFSDEDIAKVQRGEIKLKDVTDAIEKLKSEVTKRSPFQAFANELDKALGKFDKGEIGEGIQGIGAAVNKFLPKVKEFGKSIANIFGFDDSKIQSAIDAVGGLGNAAAGVGQIMSGDIAGGIMSAAGGISQVVSAVEGLFGADYSSYEKLVEQYDTLLDVWDDLLDKKKEYLDTSYGSEALRAEKEATEILNKETEAWRELGKERLNAGASLGSHSIGRRIVQEMTAADWGDISKALGNNAKKLLGERLTGLFDLSSSQLQKLKESAPAFWARMDDDVKKYLQNIIDGAEELEEVQKTAKERLTQTTFDAVRDDFKSKLADMSAAASDFSNDFSSMLFHAMLDTKVDELFSERLGKWYDQFADSMKDGAISESERSALLSDYDSIVADAMKLRDMLADATGYNKNISGEGGGAYKAASSFSQEQGDELNGRLASIQIGQERNNQSLVLAVATLQSLSVVATDNGRTLGEMRNLLLIGNSHLEDIAKYTRIAAQYGDAIEQIATKIKTL